VTLAPEREAEIRDHLKCWGHRPSCKCWACQFANDALAEIDRLRAEVELHKSFVREASRKVDEWRAGVERLKDLADDRADENNENRALLVAARAEVERLRELSEDHELVIERLESVVALLRADAERLAEALRLAPSHPTPEGRAIITHALRQHEEQA